MHTNLQPLVEGLSCSELTRLKALELLGGEGLWEFELWSQKTTFHVIDGVGEGGHKTEYYDRTVRAPKQKVRLNTISKSRTWYHRVYPRVPCHEYANMTMGNI